MQLNGNQFFCFVWIGILVSAFGVPDRCSAQQAPSSRTDIVRLPIIEGRDIRFRKLANPLNLSEIRVESIVQDRQGFIWFGTQDGLNRYDGYKFKVFKHEPGNPKSLSGVNVSSLLEDHSGNLWVGTDGFLDRFHSETESFTHCRLDKPIPRDGASPIHLRDRGSPRSSIPKKSGSGPRGHFILACSRSIPSLGSSPTKKRFTTAR